MPMGVYPSATALLTNVNVMVYSKSLWSPALLIHKQLLYLVNTISYWLGCSKSNGSNCRGLSLADNCLLGYCRPETTTVKPETLDHQCSDGREGILCGRCKPNHGLALGTSRCLPNCPGYLFYILLVVCAAGGVLLILFLIACNFTVSEGTINGLFFYAHVVHRNSTSFFPASALDSNILRLFIAWLNLDIKVCFYKSMTQYDKAWIQCGFLFYFFMHFRVGHYYSESQVHLLHKTLWSKCS